MSADWDSLSSGSALSGGVIPALLALPMAALGGWLFWRSRQKRPKAAETFSAFPWRPPGESLRLELEKIQEEFAATLLLMLAAAMAATGWIAVNPRSWMIVTPLGLLAYGWCAWKLCRAAARLDYVRLAFHGKRVVGEELNQLLRHGFHVLHDVPLGASDLDHVVVGPPGVYLVETKTRRASRQLTGRPKATVIFDGGALWFPKYTERASIEQARQHAEALSTWLSRASATEVKVRPIVTLPGWWVDQKARGEVTVLNPGEIKNAFPSRPLQPLSPALIQRLANVLAEKRRIEGK